MSLTDRLRASTADPEARSFQLMTEQLWSLTGEDLLAAGREWEEGMASVPAELRDAVVAEQREWLSGAQNWLRRHNRSLYTRIRGYLALGDACDWLYPWPAVAILGLCQVIDGLGRGRVYGLLGQALSRVGVSIVERMADGTDDILRRTNRGIFADSVPTTLLGLRVWRLRQEGSVALADALLAAPAPPLMDAQSAEVVRELAQGLALAEPERFAVLADLTLRQFGREQAIFTWNMGGTLKGRRDRWLQTRLTGLRSVPAPVIHRGWRGPRLVFRPYRLPDGFDMRDHDARVAAFGDCFVKSVTGSPEDYAVALDYVHRRFGGLRP